MSQPSPSNFHDPALKAAIRDVAGGHKAPQTLRDRVAQMVREAEVDVPPYKMPAPTKASPSSLRRYLGMAAAIALFVGAAGSLYWNYGDQWFGTRTDTSGMYAVSKPLLNGMVDTHARGARFSRTPAERSRTTHDTADVSAPLTDAKALASDATKQLGRPVPTPALPGWTLDRAAYCVIDGLNAVRFHYKDPAGRSVTFVSLPAAAWKSATADHYCSAHDGHPIAGFLAKGSLNCVVGDKDVSIADVEQLVSALRTQ